MCIKRWSNEEIDFIKKNYDKYTAKELGEKLNRTKNAVSLKINKLGLKTNKYYYNKHFFDNIDTEEKAYWLGFMYADGYVVYNAETRNYEASIELKASDFKHLLKFNKCLEGNVSITYRERERWGKIHNIASIRFYSKDLVNGLMKYGCMPNKTFYIKMPLINNKLMRHFIRGYFDGDGSIFHRKNRQGIYANFTCASYEFLTELRKFLYQLNINSYIVEDRGHYQVGLSGKENALKFFKYIYKDCNVYLDRKYKIYYNEVCLSS